MIICKICNIEFETNNLLTTHLKFKHNLSSKVYYDQYLKKENEGFCETCGKETKYISLTEGYRHFCCNSCTQKSKSVQDKIKATNRKKYGADYYSSTDKWLESVKKTNLDKYGCEFAAQNKEIKDKQIQTCIEKYGVSTYSQTNECKEKVASTNLERYGHAYLMQVDEFKDKSKQSCIEKYGYENVSQVKEIQDKKIETNQKRYGVDWFSNPEKTKQTCLEKYGVTNFTKTPEYNIKTKQTNLEKYGKEYFSQTDIWQKQSTKTSLNKFGVEHAAQNHDIRVKSQSKYMYNMKKFDSSWELAYYIWLKDNKISFEYQPNISFDYSYNNVNHKYHPDFKIDNKIQEIKGPQFFKDGKMINPYDETLNDLFEEKHQCMIKHNVEIITDCTQYLNYIDEKYGPDYLSKFKMTNIYKIYDNLGEFPYFNLKNLTLNSPYAIIQQYHKSIWHAKTNNSLSPFDAWYDENLLLKVISNRLIYKNPPYTPNKILQGLNITKLAPKVSVFKPSLGIKLINKYLSDYYEIFDPFSGFSGRMLATIKCNKKYIGQDLNKQHVLESNQIINDFNIQNCSVIEKDIFNSTGCYDSLFTCPPYENLEIWNKNETIKSCDEWIDECLNRFNCKKYLFIVDKTEKYKNNIVEIINNKSHFNKNNEYVVLIEKTGF